jgi:hypothetical protein
LFRASEAPWVRPYQPGNFVTDGPFLHRTKAGKLLMIWSSFRKGGDYAIGVAESEKAGDGGLVQLRNGGSGDKMVFAAESGVGFELQRLQEFRYQGFINLGNAEQPGGRGGVRNGGVQKRGSGGDKAEHEAIRGVESTFPQGEVMDRT